MRALVSDRGPRFQPPPEQLTALWDQFIGWRDRWRGKMESFEFFADGNGGFAVVRVGDDAELQQFVLEYPFSQFNKMEVRPIVDGDASLEVWRNALEQQAEALG